MKKREPIFIETDFSVMHDNFYDVDKERFLKKKARKERLSSGFVNYDKLKEEKAYLEETVRYITRTAYNLFCFVTREKMPAISLSINSSKAFCGLSDNKLHVGLNLLMHKKVPSQIKVDTLVAVLLHEMYHKRYTNADIKRLLSVPKFANYYDHAEVKDYVKEHFKDGTFRSLFNIVEDKRIERLGAQDFPGYVFFFEEARKYYYFLHSRKKILPEPGFEIFILDYLMTLVLLPELKDAFWKRYDGGIELFKEYQKQKEDKITLEDVKEKEESHAKVKAVLLQLDEYVKNNEELVYSDHYKDVFRAAKEMYELIPKEMTEKINSTIDRKEIRGYFRQGECGAGHSSNEEMIEVSEEFAKEIEEVISDEMKRLEKEQDEASKNNERKVKIEKIQRNSVFTQFTEYEMIEEPMEPIDPNMLAEARKISKNICNNLGFLDSRFTRNLEEFELNEGDIDDTEIHTISFGNKSIFEDIEAFPQYKLDLGILLDESGSMHSRINEAKLAMLALTLGVKDNKHINLFAYGHTADAGRRGAVQIYKYFNTLEKAADYRRIFSAKSRSSNADGFAIEKVAELMKQSKSRDKILIVISDGQPSASGYGGEDAEAHVRNVVTSLEMQGITVIQICMAYIENSARMFKYFVPFEKSGLFFENLKKILLTKLNQFSDSV